MKKKTLFSLVLLSLFMFSFLPVIIFNVVADPIDIGDISDKDFFLMDCNKVADIDKDFTLKLGFDSKMSLTSKDVSYKLIGSKTDIANFTCCVDVKVNVETGYFEFIGDVKRWGEYSIDIQPIIMDSLVLNKYVWWNSTWLYNSGSCITDNVTNYAMLINITYDNPDGWLDCEGFCQTNFSDIRFITEDNTTELYHWIEYQNNGNYAWFWVNVSDEDFINVYLGRDTAIGNSSYNNPNSTFYLFEDFTSITDWTNYAGGGFAVSGGWLTATSSTSYRYMYKTLTSGDYFLKSRGKIVSSNNPNAICSISLEPDTDTGTWILAEKNELMQLFQGQFYAVGYSTDNSANLKGATVSGTVYSTLYRFYNEYNGEFNVLSDNNYIFAQNIISGQSGNVQYVFFKIRNQATAVCMYDWVIVSKHSTTEPSFCSWYDKISYCQYNNRFVNESPTDNSIVSGINVSYITGELLILDNEADSINISLVADNGLFYINDTTNVVNGTYSLNVMLANFTDGNTYIYYVNITNGGCFASYDFSFETVYFGGYTEFQILSWKINNIYGDMVKGSDLNMNIEYVLIISWLVGAMICLFGKTNWKIPSGLFLAFSTTIMFNDYGSVFGVTVFLFLGYIISISGILDVILKYLK